jgi:hypothetical protein
MDSVACQPFRDGLDIGSVPVNTGPMFILGLLSREKLDRNPCETRVQAFSS